MHQRHLDLGCGSTPRNPYQAQELFGVDIRADLASAGAVIRGADLFREPIPFDDSFFDSVSAYDFLEHVPRAALTADATRFPFIDLMNEVWRVLKHGGRFYASTPAYPHPAAFQDPTHVNILTRQTHVYFTEPELLGRMYGFQGRFACLRSVPVNGGEFVYQPPRATGWWAEQRFKRQDRRHKFSHLVWEFKALKTAADEQAGLPGLRA